MSYLVLADGIPDFAKGVISLWFRAPRESVIAASESALDTGAEGFFMMQGILPLVTFGQPQVNRNYHGHLRDVANYTFSPDPYLPWLETYYQEGPAYDVEPSYIGLQCGSDGTFALVFNLQMGDGMVLSSTGYITTQMTIWDGEDPGAPTDISPGSGNIGIAFNVGRATIQDASYVDNAQPEFFNVVSNESFDPDEWHHLLLSFDVGSSVSIGHPFASSDCRLWYAIDDEDYRGAENLQPFRDTGDNLDENAILTRNAYRLSGVDPTNPDSYLYQNHSVPLPSGSYEGGTIPSQDAELGLPASVRYVDGIFRVEMAEFQLFTDVTLDTLDESKRRAFVDAAGVPVPPGAAEELLGQRPVVLLHGTSNWRAGTNTGSLGSNTDGEPIPSGSFERTGVIDPYTPDPSLHGAQSRSVPPVRLMRNRNARL